MRSGPASTGRCQATDPAVATAVSPAMVRRRDRVVVLAATTGLLALSWGLLLRMDHGSAPLHHAVLEPHVHGPLVWAWLSSFLMWMVMMVAMMLPAVMPWILLFTTLSRQHDATQAPLMPTGLFAGGYLAAWGAFSIAAAGVQIALQQAGLYHPAALRTPRLLGGALLIVAGVFQLSPLKAACLRHCRTPLAFFLARWRDGPAGAFGMGLRHGLWCLGCCWALMAVSFAVGVMNLLWMAALTLFLCVEKIAPRGARLGQVAGLLLVIWGIWQIG